jgi:hypothetical protein
MVDTAVDRMIGGRNGGAVVKVARLRGHRRACARLDRRLARLARIDRRLRAARLVTVLGTVLLTIIVHRVAGDPWGWCCLAAGALLFGLVLLRHLRLSEGIRRHEVWRALKAAQVARMEHDWEAIPLRDRERADPAHPFARDLDLVGPRSLQHLVDVSTSRGGSRRLREWLLAPRVDVERLAVRQAMVRDLTGMSVFRDRVALAGTLEGDDPHHAWDGERLIAWLDRHADRKPPRRQLLWLGTLAVASIALFIAYRLGGLPPYWLFGWSLYIASYLFLHRACAELFEDAEYLQYSLGRLGALVACVESQRFARDSGLEELCAPFRAAERRPSRELGRIAGIAAAAGLQRNPIPWLVVNAVVPWDVLIAVLLARWQARLREVLPVWLDVWYELEALNGLANHAYLNPAHVMPEVEAEAAPGSPCFEASAIGHPLLPDVRRVTNDFRIASIGDVALITGSNMSGKSTFLRTLGVNLSLAQAGGVVCATRLRTAPFRLFTCIQVSDSVTDGISYFYAEVRRLRALLDAFEAPEDQPLLFLVDEIFRGTNNRERLQGARAFVERLVGGDGVGVIATHDLELVKLEGANAGISNYHFREEVVDRRMQFDFRLRSGPCPTTNALRIMQMEGLPV